MPNLLKQIPETMRKKGIPEETIALFNTPETGGAEAVMELITQMDSLLSEEQRLAIMQEQGCCKTGNPAAPHRAFGTLHAGKTLAEKVELLNKANIPHKAPSHLNDDGTLSVWWGSENLRTGISLADLSKNCLIPIKSPKHSAVAAVVISALITNALLA
mgnify:CR=1 FL=1